VRVRVLGVRGSTPAPGAEFVRYGGHTSCLAVSRDGDELPTLVLDAGTGLRMLTGALGGRPFQGTILLSHLHWDHVQGVPFFAAGDRADARVDLVVPAQDGASGRDLLARFMSPPAFPITPEGLRGRWAFTAVAPGVFEADGFVVTAVEVAHKGGRTYGYRVSADGGSLGYLPDHAPALGVSPELLAAMHGVDLLVHDAQFTEAERERADDYGHATIADAVAFAEQLGAGALALFHHGPYRTDDALDRIREEAAGARLPVLVAREGDVWQVGG
jgi:phosphoribosyl 1,2-cyclic phosphodiesterase